MCGAEEGVGVGVSGVEGSGGGEGREDGCAVVEEGGEECEEGGGGGEGGGTVGGNGFGVEAGWWDEEWDAGFGVGEEWDAGCGGGGGEVRTGGCSRG